MLVILSAAKDLGAPRVRSFAALRMTLGEAKDDKRAFSILEMIRQTFITSTVFYPIFRVQFDESK